MNPGRGTYHCELGDFPAFLQHEVDGTATLSVEFAPDRTESIAWPTDRLALVFTPEGRGRGPASLAYAAEISAAHADAAASQAREAEQAVADARQALADAERQHRAIADAATEAAHRAGAAKAAAGA